MSLESTSFSFLMYFSTILRFNEAATLLVVITIILLLKHIKSTKVSDLMFLNCLLMLVICVWLCHNSFHIVQPHRYDNLFPKKTFSHHVYFWFTFLAWFAHNIEDFRNLIERKFMEGVLNLEYFLDVALGHLSI